MAHNGALLTPPPSTTDFPDDVWDKSSSFGSRSDVSDLAAGPSRKRRYQRKMGDTELSYFLPSRQTGVNDMYLHLGFKAPERVTQRARVCTVWAILRLRHPLLCAHAELRDYDDVRFIYDAPSSAEDAYCDADANLEYRSQTKDELIDTYLNGPRTLSNSRLSYLILSEPQSSPVLMPTPPRTPSPSSVASEADSASEDEDEIELKREYELLICAMHFLGDGMALHQFANDFFGLLGGGKSDDELQALLQEEWRTRWTIAPKECILPFALEDNMPLPSSRFRRVAAQVDYQLSQQRLIGGQVFPKRKHPERLTIVPTVSLPEERTKAILKKCKAHGVSISAALFAVCNVAWARMGGGSKAAPTLMYSALNLRPYLSVPRAAPWDSYWYLAIGYFNIVLPSFLPSAPAPAEQTFWLRARQAKEQSTRAAKSPLIASRAHEMAQERGARARAWAKEDDEREQGTYVPPPPPAAPSDACSPPREPVFPVRAKSSSAALLGLSLLGNLDGVYRHAAFPDAELHTLTTGSRQRQGAMLLFGYTFKGRLWISLGYDSNGFEGDVVDRFWKEAVDCVDEYLG